MNCIEYLKKSEKELSKGVQNYGAVLTLRREIWEIYSIYEKWCEYKFVPVVLEPFLCSRSYLEVNIV